MSEQRVNPYASPALTSDQRTQLTFDAVIEEHDYAALQPSRDFEWLLYTILSVLLTMTTLILLSAVIAGLVFKGWDNVVVPVIAIGLVTAGGSIFVVRFRRPLRRAQRNLKRYPDLLGVARGKLTESGLAFHDGTRQHWYGPQQLLASTVSAAGIRVRVDDNPLRFLALTSRMFDHYSEQVAARLLQSWRDAAATTSSNAPAGLELWQELNPEPEDAIAFRGAVTIQQPLRTPQLRHAAIIELVVALSSLLGGLLGSKFFGSWFRYGLIAYGIFGLISSGRSWWRYFRGTSVQTWNQRGWISPDELALARQSAGVRIPLSEIGQVTDHDSVIMLTSHAGVAYFLARDHVQTDDEWTEIGDRCRGLMVENR